MQFHLNGFRPGDPHVSERVGPAPAADRHAALPEQLDLLIVGCGPTGLTLAAQLAVFPDIETRIVDQKPGPLLVGQADGIACRTVEMFEAFGFSERVLKEAYWVNETAFWKPDDTRRERIVRSDRIQDTEDGLSEFPHVILNQARVHDFYLDVMHNSPSRLAPDYSRRLVDLRIVSSAPGPGDRNSPSHPVQVTLERLDAAHAGALETVRARFVIGCDGARSTVRRLLGLALHGDSANQAWGVMDVLAVTDFPDIRLKSVIHSANDGNMLIIPREGGYLVRFYIELDRLSGDERIAGRNISIDQLIAVARRILRPYTLDVKEVAWWSVYEIGQRLCAKFDDVPESQAPTRHPRVFIAGDACHTHSPKAGQGMNVSMQDAFNLGWKLGSVIREQCTPQILHTYSAERRAVASELIDFDREFAKMFSARPRDLADMSSEGVDPRDFQAYFVKQARFTAGTATRYHPSIISGPPTWQHLARGFVIGMRFHSAPVIRLADARPIQLGHAIRADGRWRIFAFSTADHPADSSSPLRALCTYLTESEASPVKRYTPNIADVDSVIDVRAVFQQGHHELEVENLPLLLRPRKGRYGLCDHEKAFCPDIKAGQDIFDMRSIDRGNGCMVVVRPDQYVAHVLPLTAHAELSAFFDGFMVQSSRARR
jgi:phenol 2-monooxygenase